MLVCLHEQSYCVIMRGCVQTAGTPGCLLRGLLSQMTFWHIGSRKSTGVNNKMNDVLSSISNTFLYLIWILVSSWQLLNSSQSSFVPAVIPSGSSSAYPRSPTLTISSVSIMHLWCWDVSVLYFTFECRGGSLLQFLEFLCCMALAQRHSKASLVHRWRKC